MQKPQRLSKVLAQAGIASRRACEELIFDGKVTVNGDVTLVPQTHVVIGKDEISVNGKEIVEKQAKVYYILNKPPGYICTNLRPGSKKIVLDLFTSVPYKLFTVGRLDRETTGLLIVTNDGHFANKVIHPSSNISKEYLIKVQQEVSQEHILAILKGAFVEGSWVRPKRVTKVRKGTLKIVVKEGKKREIRTLVEEAGLTLYELKRIRIGNLTLGTIPEGTWREMTDLEKAALFA